MYLSNRCTTSTNPSGARCGRRPVREVYKASGEREFQHPWREVDVVHLSNRCTTSNDPERGAVWEETCQIYKATGERDIRLPGKGNFNTHGARLM